VFKLETCLLRKLIKDWSSIISLSVPWTSLSKSAIVGYSFTALRWCLEGVEGVLRSFLWWDEANLRCSDSLEVGPLFLRGVADAADLALLLVLTPTTLSLGLGGKILMPAGTLTIASCLADGPLRRKGCGGAVRTGWA